MTAATTATTTTATATTTATTPANRLCALVVEDDAAWRELLVRALGRAGVDAVAAADAEAALLALAQGPCPDVAIVDLMMPRVGGAAVLRRIREAGLPVRVAVVSAVREPFALIDVLRHPPDRAFTKPVNLAELLAWVRGSA